MRSLQPRLHYRGTTCTFLFTSTTLPLPISTNILLSIYLPPVYLPLARAVKLHRHFTHALYHLALAPTFLPGDLRTNLCFLHCVLQPQTFCIKRKQHSRKQPAWRAFALLLLPRPQNSSYTFLTFSPLLRRVACVAVYSCLVYNARMAGAGLLRAYSWHALHSPSAIPTSNSHLTSWPLLSTLLPHSARVERFIFFTYACQTELERFVYSSLCLLVEGRHRTGGQAWFWTDGTLGGRCSLRETAALTAAALQTSLLLYY